MDTTMAGGAVAARATEALSWAAMERAEVLAWEDVHRCAREMGIPGPEVVRFGVGAAIFTPGVDLLSMNRAVALAGRRIPVRELAPALVGAFRSRGTERFFLQLPPGVDPAIPVTPTTLLEAAGFRRHNRWVRLYREAGEAPWVLTDLDVVPAEPGYAGAFGRIVTDCFGYPHWAEPWMAALPGRAGWRAFVALEGPVPVSTGAFHVQGEVAWMGFSATLPGRRGRGAQLAVISEMVLQATGLGCRHLVVETAEDRPEHPAHAYRNGLRLGFREMYRRENWIWAEGGG